MGELRAITAISDSTFEALVAKTLFDNGWSVEKRLIDARDIIAHATDLIVLSMDLHGLDMEIINQLLRQGYKVIAFGPNPEGFAHHSLTIHEPVGDGLQLLPLLRGVEREPLLQSSTIRSSIPKKVILVASARPGVGASLLAANIALELSGEGKKTLAVDADINFPSLFEHFGVRELSAPRAITPTLSIVDLSQLERERHLRYLADWSMEFERIVMDLGALGAGADLRSDRRQNGLIAMWALDYSLTNLIISSPQSLDMNGHRLLLQSLRSAKPQSHFLTVVNKVERGEKLPEKEGVFYLPQDLRAVSKCRKATLLLAEGAPRSALAKALSQFVGQALM